MKLTTNTYKKSILTFMACSLSLSMASANNSCDLRYVRAINETYARHEEIKSSPAEISKAKKRKVINGAGVVTSAVVVTNAANLSALGVSPAIFVFLTVFGALPIQVADGLGKDYYGASDELPKLYERANVLSATYKLIKEAQAGGGPLIQALTPEIWKQTKKSDILPIDVATTINLLNESSAFCENETELDTMKAIFEKTVQKLKE